MKNYEKPFILTADTLAEGIYATGMSGNGPEDPDGECWVMGYENIPSNNVTTNPGWNKTGWKIEAKHGCVKHISYSTKMTFTIAGDTVTAVEIEGVKVPVGSTGHSSDYLDNVYGAWRFELKVEANRVQVIRRCHANAYENGAVTDNFDIDIQIYSASGTAVITGLTYTCEHRPNVQGGFD